MIALRFLSLPFPEVIELKILQTPEIDFSVIKRHHPLNHKRNDFPTVVQAPSIASPPSTAKHHPPSLDQHEKEKREDNRGGGIGERGKGGEGWERPRDAEELVIHRANPLSLKRMQSVSEHPLGLSEDPRGPLECPRGRESRASHTDTSRSSRCHGRGRHTDRRCVVMKAG